MNYFKSALAGFGMSFIGTSLCGAKMGAYLEYSHEDHKNSKFLKFLLLKGVLIIGDKQYFIHIPEELKSYIKTNKDCSCSITDEFSKILKPYDAWCCDSWTFPKAFIHNNAWFIPTAILGAAYHDYFGRPVADKFNNYFKTDVSSYILDGAVFGACIVGAGIFFSNMQHIDKAFITSIAIIQGFVLGCTAAFGAYFGDEEVPPQNEELDVTPLDPC